MERVGKPHKHQWKKVIPAQKYLYTPPPKKKKTSSLSISLRKSTDPDPRMLPISSDHPLNQYCHQTDYTNKSQITEPPMHHITKLHH
jgi:hypothetical protein